MRGTPPSRVRERPSCAWELYPAAGKARERRPREAGSAMVCDGFLASALMLNFNHVVVPSGLIKPRPSTPQATVLMPIDAGALDALGVPALDLALGALEDGAALTVDGHNIEDAGEDDESKV